MAIRDNRILIADAESLDPTTPLAGDWVDEAESTMAPAINEDLFIEGISSISDRLSNTAGFIGFRADADQDWSNNVFYVWWASAAARSLDLFEFGGIRLRFTGASETDYFEIYLDGADTYTGGFKMAVVDIEVARAAAIAGAATSPAVGGDTGGTVPATTAIRRIGIWYNYASTAPGSADNSFVDAMWRLPIGEPGVIVSGQNTDVSPIRPYNWADILDAGDNGDPTKAWGVIREDQTIIFVNAPIQFGNSGSPDDGDHDFEDVNQVIAWEDQIVNDSFYGFTIVGDNVNAQRFVAGLKTGVVGSQGWTILSGGPRWFIESTDADLDQVDFFGCSLSDTGVIDIDHSANEMRSCLLIGGQRLHHSRIASPRSGAVFEENTIILADPIGFDESPLITSPENVAYIWTADPNKIRNNAFLFFAGHGINLLEEGTFQFVGNTFDALWNTIPASPDGQQTLEAGLLNLVGEITLNVSGGGDTPTTFDAFSPGTTINNNISVTLTNIQPGTEIRVYPVESPVNLNEIDGVESVGSPAEFTFSGAAGLVVRIVVFHLDFVLPPANEFELTIPNADTSFPISQIIDRNYLNPA